MITMKPQGQIDQLKAELQKTVADKLRQTGVSVRTPTATPQPKVKAAA